MVPLADGGEGGRGAQADQLVDLLAEGGRRVRRGDRHGQDDPGRSVRPRHPAGGRRRGAGGDAVVDHDRRATLQRDRRAPLPEAVGLPDELGLLGPLHLGEVVLVDPAHPDDVVAQDPDTALADRAHAQLAVVGHAQLADEDHVQRGAQHVGDLEGHGHAAARQAQDDRVLGAQVSQPVGQSPAGVHSVDESHDPPPAPGPGSGRLRKTRKAVMPSAVLPI